MTQDTTGTIAKAFAEGKPIDRAFARAAWNAWVSHMRMGLPLVTTDDDGKPIRMPPEEFARRQGWDPTNLTTPPDFD